MQEMMREREAELQRELGRQQDNDVARQKFAKEANLFYDWVTSTRYIACFHYYTQNVYFFIVTFKILIPTVLSVYVIITTKSKTLTTLCFS